MYPLFPRYLPFLLNCASIPMCGLYIQSKHCPTLLMPFLCCPRVLNDTMAAGGRITLLEPLYFITDDIKLKAVQ